jgi:diguanylate cyclase (GGDEF)-like protein
MTLGDRLLKAARATEIDREGVRIKLAVSIGIAALLPGEDLHVWLLRADRALYEAKRQGRNRLVAADETATALVSRG